MGFKTKDKTCCDYCLTCPYDLDTVEEAFDVALKLDLTFKTLVNAKARCSKFKRYGHYDYQCPSECQHVTTMSSNDVNDSKVIEDVHVPPKTVSIIEDISVGSDTPIIDEIYWSSDSASDDVDEIIEPNTLTVPSKPFESPCAEYSFMVVLIDSSFSESPEFLTKIQHMVYSASSFSGCLEFVCESNVLPSLDMCPPSHPTYLIPPSL